MPNPALLLAVGAAWGAAAVALAVLIGRVARAAEPQPEPDDLCALVQPGSWGPEAVAAEFTALIPSIVTAESFALDAEINRQFEEWA